MGTMRVSAGHTLSALVVLAAGLGQRYRAAKQLAGVGANGEWLLEYAIHDALAAGFTQIVLVIRPELRAPLTERLIPRLDGRATLQLVEQSLDQVPSGCHVPDSRPRPLGTGHALWCCMPFLRAAFAVINADDYYGANAFRLLAEHFSCSENPAMVGYHLDATLSPYGPVNRGICDVDSRGYLRGVAEYTDIAIRDGALGGTAPNGVCTALSSRAVVSLNCWGLTPELLPDLERGLRAFLATAGNTDEYFLPHAVAAHLTRRTQKLSVLPSTDTWLGLTYPSDHARVVKALAALHAAGLYASPLWAHP